MEVKKTRTVDAIDFIFLNLDFISYFIPGVLINNDYENITILMY
jgi:hypothetical protein